MFELYRVNIRIRIVHDSQLRDIRLVVPNIPTAHSKVFKFLHVIENAFQRALEHKVCCHAVDLDRVARIHGTDKAPGTPSKQLPFPMSMCVYLGSYKSIGDQLLNNLAWPATESPSKQHAHYQDG
jgi:hypothetical protein